MNLRQLPDIPLSELAEPTRRVEERLANVSVAAIRRIGAYAKSVDPEMIDRLRDDGEPVNAKAVGLYILQADPDTFYDLLLDE